MRLTFIQPAIGHRRDRRPGEGYIRTWQMEPLTIAALTGLTPPDIALRFHDDRLEQIPYDEPTDAVVMPVETYTAKRAYQIASRYRSRGIPVIMGGFHVTLMPQEAARYAEIIVTGEAESVWADVIDDLRCGRPASRYHGERGSLALVRPDRRLFSDKRYLPIGLVETGRGCRFPCEFCAIQTFFGRTHRARPVDAVVSELQHLQAHKKLFFFVDDNFAGDMKAGRALLPELARLPGLRWVTQISINAAHDEDFVSQLRAGGCKGVLIGFESLNEDNLRLMGKRFNTMKSGYAGALANLRRHGIAVYGTFIFGYDHDTASAFEESVDFAMAEGMYIAAFNHITPFPGTPLYQRLQQEGRLRFDAWWLDDRYRYNELPFHPRMLTAAQVTEGCVQARRRFYGWPSMARRQWRNLGDGVLARNFLWINAMHRGEVSQRNGYPLGDEASLDQPLIEVA